MVSGITIIHEDVFREIVRSVLDKTEGIYRQEVKNPLAPLLGDKGNKPNITIRWPEAMEEKVEQVEVEIRLAILYGAAIPQMVTAIRKNVAAEIQKYTGYNVNAVDIYITKLIRFEKERSLSDEQQAPSNNQNAEGF